ncbi:hypothetical protein ACIRBZ_10955 [Streptomyces sp. NPDC094038]|uniref:hypothetical protein n=1 Tax=Streptomyces sp. NPDC094038 TaxID=3366055 RepID=UPI003814E972
MYRFREDSGSRRVRNIGFRTHRDKKAGALNPWFVETALATFNRKVGAVGGVLYGEDGGGFLGLLQRMEFHRYAWELSRTGLSFLVYLTYMAAYTSLYGWPGLSPFWTAIGPIFVVEKTVSVRRAGPKAVLIAALMVPETLYDLFQHAVYFTSLWGPVRRSEEKRVAT